MPLLGCARVVTAHSSEFTPRKVGTYPQVPSSSAPAQRVYLKSNTACNI